LCRHTWFFEVFCFVFVRKPENLLLDDQNNVKLADFGLSNTMRDGFFLKTSCGSPNYAAPEVISGKLYAGPEVDVWSCGVILYALLCGSLPFDDDNIPNLFRKIKGGVYSLPTYLSEQARDLIPKMLVVDPLQRISLADIKKHPFYQRELPLYLGLSADELIAQSRLIDDQALQKVVAMGYSKELVLQALGCGPELIISERYPNQEKLRPAAVAYNLFLDEKRKADSMFQNNPCFLEFILL
jgi:5'-AMP-activated protein kinase catalytic alpha subunit